MKCYDYIVVGLGCSGLMSLERLSRDNKVLGIDKHGIKNEFGSSHGETRIYRLSYYEGKDYLEMLKDSYRMWKNMEKKTGREFLEGNGFLFLGDNKGMNKIELCEKSCVEAEIDYKRMSSEEINNSQPYINVNSDVEGIYHKDGGFMKSGDILESVSRICKKRKNSDIINKKVTNINIKENQVKIECGGEEYKCKKLIMATGPWIENQFEKLDFLQIEKHIYCKYKGNFNMNSSTISFIGKEHFYGLPDTGKYDIKIGKLGEDKKVNKMDEFYSSKIEDKKIRNNQRFVKKYFSAPFEEYSYGSCPITRTPDDNYVIDYHPDHHNIVLCCGMSGHGFKLSNYNAKIVSDLVKNKHNKYSEGIFDISRFL